MTHSHTHVYTYFTITFTHQVTKFSMHHAGSLNGETYSCVEDPLGTHSVLGTLLPVLYCSHGNKAASQTGYGQPEPMLAVAIEMKIDKERNSKVHCVYGTLDTPVFSS